MTITAAGMALNTMSKRAPEPLSGTPVPRTPRPRRLAALLLSLTALAGCSAIDRTAARLENAVTGGPGLQPGQQGYVRGFLGNVAAEEPRAALVARDILSAGGSAADAAVAAGFTLAVTLPSRAGLGGGGACLGYDPRRNEIEAFLFQPGARQGVPRGADRPAALPMMARGLFALHARQGRLPFERAMAPAEQLARFGTPVSRALASDLAAVSCPLLADPVTRAVFAPNGAPVGEGATLTQVDLATTLGSIRTAGVGDFHQGGLARRLEESSAAAGGFLTVPELRAAVPRAVPPTTESAGSDLLATLPGADGAAVRAAFQAAAGGGTAPVVPGLYGATTTIAVQDRDGGAVSCAFTMNNLFGTGRTVPGLGFLLAPAPGLGSVQTPPLGVVLVANTNVKRMRYAGAGSGQGAAPAAAGSPAALFTQRRVPLGQAITAGVPEPGRGVAVACQERISAGTCAGVVDPRGFGLASGND